MSFCVNKSSSIFLSLFLNLLTLISSVKRWFGKLFQSLTILTKKEYMHMSQRKHFIRRGKRLRTVSKNHWSTVEPRWLEPSLTRIPRKFGAKLISLTFSVYIYSNFNPYNSKPLNILHRKITFNLIYMLW